MASTVQKIEIVALETGRVEKKFGLSSKWLSDYLFIYFYCDFFS